jgi:hypothetical protein
MITVGWHCCTGGTGTNSLTPIRSSSGEPSIRRAGGIVEELLASMQSLPSPNLGLLLIGFLQSFGREIDFSHVRLVLKVHLQTSNVLPGKSTKLTIGFFISFDLSALYLHCPQDLNAIFFLC